METLINNYTVHLHKVTETKIYEIETTHEKFEAHRYWRGPVWLQVNWLLEKGFRQYGFDKLADQIKEDALALVKRDGFYEYFNPKKDVAAGKGGYGGSHFSWTAAVVIDFLNDTK